MEANSDYKKYFFEKKLVGPPKPIAFEQATEFCKFLKLFYNVTLKFSGSLHVTSNVAFLQVSHVASILYKAA